MATGMMFPDFDEVHPLARGPFVALANELHYLWSKGLIPVWFRPFEIYRTPQRQVEMLRTGKSKAGPWSSAHQYGLAVDFVPYIRGSWSWTVPLTTWDHLREQAHKVGLLNDIEWDRAHVEHPAFAKLRAALQPKVSAVPNAAHLSEQPPKVRG